MLRAIKRVVVGGLPLMCLACGASAALYEVGPGKAHTAIGTVPWESLQAGDTVLIYWRTNNYREKWVICRQGTLAAPITVRGVPGPGGQLPVIEVEPAILSGVQFGVPRRGRCVARGRNCS